MSSPMFPHVGNSSPRSLQKGSDFEGLSACQRIVRAVWCTHVQCMSHKKPAKSLSLVRDLVTRNLPAELGESPRAHRMPS